MSAGATQRRIAYAKSRGLSIAYSVTGDGPVDLVYVPGFVSHQEVAHEFPPVVHVVNRLAGFARVISFDKPGTGLSDPVTGAPTLEERMEDLGAVLDAVQADRPALLGVSEGAPMCALFAATHPERVRALVMYGSYARGSAAPDYPWAPGAAQVEAALESIEDVWGTGAWLDVYAPSLARDRGASEWWARYERLSASPAMARAVIRLASQIDIRDVLPAISVPTLVVHRIDDGLWPLEGARWVAAAIPGAEMVTLEGVDHLPFAGDADAWLREVELFLTGSHPAPEVDRQLLTVAFSDIAGSTALAAELGDRRWRELLELHNDATRTELRSHAGREIKATGDGFLATFAGPARAIAWARAVSSAVRPLGLEVRIGIHTGECEVVGDDIAGMAVHIGARIGSLADPGEVLVSGTVRDLVVGSEIEFEPRGTRLLKGVPGEWPIFAVAA